VKSAWLCGFLLFKKNNKNFFKKGIDIQGTPYFIIKEI
jgi:hypothetical protein